MMMANYYKFESYVLQKWDLLKYARIISSNCLK